MVNKAIHILRESALSVTPQRVAILEILLTEKGHPSPEWIYNLALEKYPNMSLATVYNTLERFEEIGIVTKVNALYGTARYDAITDFHPHVVCVSCGRIEDVPADQAPVPSFAQTQIGDFTVRSMAVHLLGYCGPCMEREMLKDQGNGTQASGSGSKKRNI